MAHAIPLQLPMVTDLDAEALAAALRAGPGTIARELEARIAEVARRPYGVAVGSPGAGLEVALRALSIGAGDEVILPALGSLEAADAVVRVGASPVFADVDPRTLVLSATAADSLVTDRTRAILAFSLLGDAGSLAELAHLCTKHEIPLVEDASDALGGEISGQPVGRFGRIAVFALTDERPVPASGATILVTHDDRLAARARGFREVSARLPHEVPPALGDLAERVGVDSPLDEFRAALATSRLGRLAEALELRRRRADAYVRRLSAHPDLILPAPRGDGGACWSRFCVRLSDRFGEHDRDEVLAGLRRHEVLASRGPLSAPSLPRHGHRVGHAAGAFPVSERAAARSIYLPFFESITDREIDLVCQTLDLMIQRTTFRRE